MAGPMDMIFGVFSETYVRVLKSITSQFFSRYSKSNNNLNIIIIMIYLFNVDKKVFT